LQIDESNFSHARVAGRPIPLSILERVAWRSDCRLAWLQTGAAPQFEAGQGPLVSSLSEDLQACISLMREAPARVHAIFLRVARLLVRHHPNPIRILQAALIMNEQGPLAARALKADVPDPPAAGS
jgi:hypothetical protein